MSQIQMNKMLSSGNFKEEQAFWKEKLQGNIPISHFPFDFTNHTCTITKSVKEFSLAAPLGQKLWKMANGSDFGLYILLLSSVCFLINRHTDEKDILIGTPLFNSYSGTGVLNNHLFIGSSLNEEETFKEYIVKITKDIIDVRKHQNIPSSYLFELLNMEPYDAINYAVNMVVMLNNIQDESYLHNINPRLLIKFNRNDEKISGRVVFDSSHYHMETINKIVERLIMYLEQVTDNPSIKLVDIDIISLEERKLLETEFINTRTVFDYPSSTIHGIFELRANSMSDMPAIYYQGNSITYGEVNAEANRIANLLQENGIREGQIVGLSVERSPYMFYAILGILKAGCAYLPIEPNAPVERTKYILDDSRCEFVLTNDPNNSYLDYHNVRFLCDDQDSVAQKSMIPNMPLPSHDMDGSELCYVLYTSGSTGKPKGVMIEHQNVLNVLYGLQTKYPVTCEDAYLLKTTFTFDISVPELFGWFLEGGKLAILEHGAENNPEALLQAIKRYDVTHVNFVPSQFKFILDYIAEKRITDFGKLKYILFCGEVLSKDLIDKFIGINKDINMENLYGPTEATVYSTAYNLRDLSLHPIPIGKPLPNVRLYVLNKKEQMLPIGIPGELYISGAGVARSYLVNGHDEREINKKFVSDKFGKNGTMYRTGDLVQWLPDGNLKYIGRMDTQVKIKGYRIELQEIESVLRSYHDIVDAVTADKMNSDGDRYLCAYIRTNNEFIDLTDLRNFLLKQLPVYMVPSHFVLIDKIPTLQNGKVDRNALPDKDLRNFIRHAYVPPESELEQILVKVWQEILDYERVGVTDNFYDLSGDSIRALRIVSKLSEMGYHLEIKLFLNRPTIREMTSYIEKKSTLIEEESFTQSLPEDEMQSIIDAIAKVRHNE